MKILINNNFPISLARHVIADGRMKQDFTSYEIMLAKKNWC